MGGFISSAIGVVAPIAGAIFGGPVGAAIGGAIGAAATGGNVLQGAVMGGIGSYVGGALGGGATAGGATAADIAAAVPGIAASDAAVLANAGITAAGASGLTAAEAATAAQAYVTAAAAGTGIQGAISQLTTAPNAMKLIGALTQGAASVYGSQQVAQSAQNAAAINQAATQSALALQATQFNQSQANQQPWLTAGTQALGAQQDLMGLGANGAAGQLTALQSSPGYQFQLDQGNKGLTNSLAARGGMGSGASAVAASKYNQDYASTAYNNRLAQLSSLSTTGQNTATGMGAQAMNYANNASATGIAGSNTQANAGLVAAQANQSGLVGASNALMGYLNPSQSTLRAA